MCVYNESQSQCQDYADDHSPWTHSLCYGGGGGAYSAYAPGGVPGGKLFKPDRTYEEIDPRDGASIKSKLLQYGASLNDCSTTPTLKAKFSGTPLEIHPGESVTFTDASTQADNPITSWTWTFTGGNPGTFNGQNPPAITYANEGSYNVKLKVSDGSGNDETIKENYVIVSNYCSAASENLNSGYEHITNVKLESINKTSGVSTYSDFTSEVATIGNTTETATVTMNTGYAEDKLYAWIDWNKDGDFDDAGEQVCNKPANASDSPISFDVIAPASFTADNNGTTRMRIRLNDTYSGTQYDNTSNETPCGTSTYGEVEDYTININITPAGINTLSDNIFAIYPNPSNGVFNIITTSNSNSEITISDVSGKVVYNNNTNLNNVSVDLSEINKGIYIVKVTNETGVKVERIIIK